MKNGSEQGQNSAQPAAKTKVLFVITKSNWGGAQRYVYDIATHLPQEFEPVVAYGPAHTSEHPGILAEKLQAAHVRTIFVPALTRDIGIADMAAFRELKNLYETERPHVVHLNSSKAGIIGALAARATRVPRIVFTAHGWPFWEQRPLPWRIVAWVGSFLTACLTHRTICISHNDLRAFARMPFVGHRQTLIYNGIDMSVSFGTGTAIRDAFPADAHITGTIGELTANKNQIALIEQAKTDSHMHVAIVGEGEERAFLEEKVRQYGLTGRVKFFGFIPAIEVLRGFDSFSLPSLKEGLPYVLLEARLAGLPIEAAHTGGVEEALSLPLSNFSLEEMVRKTVALYRYSAPTNSV
jgi:glycosyltransferase involved in cell wall biosynthesis